MTTRNDGPPVYPTGSETGRRRGRWWIWPLVLAVLLVAIAVATAAPHVGRGNG